MYALNRSFFLVNVCSMIRYEIPNDWNARDFITTTTTFVSTYIAVAFWFIWFYSGLYRAWLEFYIISVKVKMLIGNPEIVVESIFIFIALCDRFFSRFLLSIHMVHSLSFFLNVLFIKHFVIKDVTLDIQVKIVISVDEWCMDLPQNSSCLNEPTTHK